MGRRLLAIAALLVGACAHVSLRDMKNFQATDQDFADIASACLDTVERTSHVTTIVVPAGTDRRVRAALSKLRPLASPAAIPSSAAYTLPENWFVLQAFEIADGEATFEGQLGPVRRVPQPPAIDDCGTNFAFQYYLEPSGWYSPSYKITICTESRHWVPVEEAAKP